MLVRLVRLSKDNHPTGGVLLLNDRPSFVTLELPWLNNERKISCIPAGEYKLKKRSASASITGGWAEAYEILNVPARSDILIHVANTTNDLLGCVGIGMCYHEFSGQLGIARSKEAFGLFMNSLRNGTEHRLIIKEFDGWRATVTGTTIESS